MKTSISDPLTLVVLENQLRSGKVSWIFLEPYEDYEVRGHQLAVYSSTLAAEDGVVFDVWVVTCEGNSGYYNQVNYPTSDDAVAQHIGRLVIDDKIDLVDKPLFDIPENPAPEWVEDDFIEEDQTSFE